MPKRTTKPRVSVEAAQFEAETAFSKRIHLGLFVWMAIGLLLFNFLTGWVAYGVMTVWCMRLPITGTKYGASYHYFKPGDLLYGPNPVNNYYCSEQDARDDGLHPSTVLPQ